ncbi:hypothetical protein IscW_ISCW004986 [Ixodes scapularis]|uniref:Uncharacterized protein n=1 Tax=Ixodes scapularis TaxID=6945 RepID=B7PFV9_IXOSC|nr:hypothetical protein IscW_ISCW004986 [Ixodes scapularis]|eukprot:XP_002434081.1 hypothetical protein IscW_ISCW004986 [Ixodes scapularis]
MKTRASQRDIGAGVNHSPLGGPVELQAAHARGDTRRECLVGTFPISAGHGLLDALAERRHLRPRTTR